MTQAGLGLAIPGSVGRGLFHWATGPLLSVVLRGVFFWVQLYSLQFGVLVYALGAAQLAA